MSISKLPEYIINRLKAGEVVEKPASIIKELVENSLDADATKITINLHDGGKKLIQVEDNGSGIELSDMELLLKRYTTSKIKDENDLLNIQSYGFRGEALASIAEVSKISIMSKTAYSEIWTKLTKRWSEINIHHLPVPFEHWTLINIEDIFYNIPARQKFLKSPQTEYFYCYKYFVDIALWHWQKHFILKKNEKIIFDLHPTQNILERINHLFKKDYSKKLNEVIYQNNFLHLEGYASDPSLRFGSGEHIKIYVNSRPIHDKIIRRALLDAYQRQISSWEYPFAILMLQINPEYVDVNVHPRKSEVKFTKSKDIYQIIYNSVTKTLSENKIGHTDNLETNRPQNIFSKQSQTNFGHKASSNENTPIFSPQNLSAYPSFDNNKDTQDFHQDLGDYQIIGQLRNSYIALQTEDWLHYIDQHALAERISFEKMKKALTLEDGLQLSPELLLQPLSIDIAKIANIEPKIQKLNQLGFDCSLLWDNKLVIYAVPKIFVIHKVDFENLFNHILYLETINFDHILNKIFATKACKTSIKAGHKLSYQQMANLIKEGFEHIPWMFVCQHGRPFFIKIDKKNIDKLFER